MAASKGSRIASLLFRILTLIFISISLLIIATNSKTLLKGTLGEVKIKFKDIYSYRYLISAAIIGAVLSLIQIILTIFHIVSKSDGTPLFDLFTDKLLSYLLLSGASAGLGAGIDLKGSLKDIIKSNILNSFFNKGNAAAAILLLAFFCTAIVSILSSLALVTKY